MYEVHVECTGRYQRLDDWKTITKLESDKHNNRIATFKCKTCELLHRSYLSTQPTQPNVRKLLSYLLRKQRDNIRWYEWASNSTLSSDYLAHAYGEMQTSVEAYREAREIFDYRPASKTLYYLDLQEIKVVGDR